MKNHNLETLFFLIGLKVNWYIKLLDFSITL